MRALLVLIVVIVFIGAGVVVGALNPEMVSYDLGVTIVDVPKGAALLGALAIGWFLGGLIAWSGTARRKRRHKGDALPAIETTDGGKAGTA